MQGCWFGVNLCDAKLTDAEAYCDISSSSINDIRRQGFFKKYTKTQKKTLTFSVGKRLYFVEMCILGIHRRIIINIR